MINYSYMISFNNCYLRLILFVYSETFDMDFRPAPFDGQNPVVKSDNNRPLLHPTTPGHPHQSPVDYHVGAIHGQRRNNESE